MDILALWNHNDTFISSIERKLYYPFFTSGLLCLFSINFLLCYASSFLIVPWCPLLQNYLWGRKYYNWHLYKFCDIYFSINADGVIRLCKSLQRRSAAQESCSPFCTRSKYPRCTACAGNKNFSSTSRYRNWILRFLDTQYYGDNCEVWCWNDDSFWF